MKANRKSIDADDAVSPVIAVILMVAITVVLAATVYLWVSGFGANQKQLVNASFGAKAIDLPSGWGGTDTDTSDDAIEFTLASADDDLANADIVLSVDGQLLSWLGAATDMFLVGGDSTEDEVCTGDPGDDGDDIWERGASIILVDTADTILPSAVCDGTGNAATDYGNLDGVHTVKITVRGQVVLDTSIEVHDNAAN